MTDRSEEPFKLTINRGKLNEEVIEQLHSRLLQKLASLDKDPVPEDLFSKSGFSKNGFSRSSFSKSHG